MSPIGSYVGGLTSKGQVGVLLGEHRGWILRMAALIKGRLSDNRPEACGAFFQTKITLNISMLSYEKTGSRYEIRDTRRMRKIFIKDIFNILLHSFVLTKWILLSTDV